jgi:hypothetical protein
MHCDLVIGRNGRLWEAMEAYNMAFCLWGSEAQDCGSITILEHICWILRSLGPFTVAHREYI